MNLILFRSFIITFLYVIILFALILENLFALSLDSIKHSRE